VTPTPSQLTWQKSSRSNTGNCVEVARNHAARIYLRDSKDPEGLILSFCPDAWTAFVVAVKGSTFDFPAGRTP
jgi:hypothetical protein